MRSSRDLLLWSALAGAVTATLPAATADAEEIDATITALMLGRQDPRDGEVHTTVPMFTLVSITASAIENPWFDDVKVVIGAWGRVDPGEPLDDRLVTGDVDIGYVEGSLLEDRIRLRLGRQMIIGGAARNSVVDGIELRAQMWRKFGISAYGGSPVTRHFEIDRGDAVTGARLFWRPSVHTEAGLSFIHLRLDGGLFRQDVGADARYRVLPSLTLRGYGLLSTVETRIAEIDVGAEYRATKNIETHAEYRRTAPDLFLPRNSILTVFSDEERDEVGGSAFYRPRPRIRTRASYYYVSVEGGDGFRTDGEVKVFVDDAFKARVGAELRYFDSPTNAYLRMRLDGSYRASERLNFSADADTYLFDREINGESTSFTGLVAGSYEISSGWNATLVGIGGATPFVSQRYEVMAKLVYGVEHRVREVLP